MADLLQVMPEYVLHWMVQKGKERQLQQKEVIIREGEKCDSLFLVLDGLFDVYAGGTDQRHIERVAPGNMLGEVSFFTDGVATATVIAEECSLVLELSRRVLSDKLAYDHEYAADLYKAVLTSL